MNLYIDGKVVEQGAKLKDFRGDVLYFAGIAQEPSPGKSGKCYFAIRKRDARNALNCAVYYPGVVNGEIK